MLQYNLKIGASDRYSFAELAQMAIEGGCRWIVADGRNTEHEVFKEELTQITDLCRESSVILTLRGDAALAKELGIHGVLVDDDSLKTAVALREDFGPEAIVGCVVSGAEGIRALEKADIDFAVLSLEMDTEQQRDIISQIRRDGNPYPIVIDGDIDPATAHELLAEGASGVCTGKYISQSSNPTEAVEEYLAQE